MKKITTVVLAAILLISPLLLSSCGRGNITSTSPAAALLIHEHQWASRDIFSRASQVAFLEPSPIAINEALQNQTPREGYILAPNLFGTNGVDSLSSFILRTPTPYVDRMPDISIDGGQTIEIRREDNNTFIIIPSVPLVENSLYVFRLNREGNRDITWAFQTAQTFKIVSTMPGNESTNVPVRSVVEVIFSFGHPDISEHFTISPQAEGRFITEGRSVIFMPTDPLEHGTVYTITLSPGITSPETGETLDTAFSFQFETEPDHTAQREERNIIRFTSNLVEFPSLAEPSVSFWTWGIPAARRIDMNVYRFESRDDAIRAANRLAQTPIWTIVHENDRFVSTGNMERVLTARHTLTARDSWSSETFTFPTTLPPGFYLLEASADNAMGQIIVQISDLAVQVIADENMTLIWINDMTTGMAADRATVYHTRSGTSAVATDYGIAILEERVEMGEYIIVATDNGKEVVVFAHQGANQWITRGWWGFPAQNEGHNSYWNALQLDRTLFQRQDTINIWGFVQNRHMDEDISFVTVRITEQTWWRMQDMDTLIQQNIPVTNGAFSGEIRLPNIDPGSYQLTVYHGGHALNSIFFTVQDYVTPPYRMTASANRTAIFAGETVSFSVRTEFFEGTPVPELELTYDFWTWELSVPSSGRARTDMDGNFSINAAPTAIGANVQGERSITFAVHATLPEIGFVHQTANVRVFVNDMNVDARGTREGTDANLDINIHEITLDRINNGTATHWGDFLDQPVGGRTVSVEIIEMYWEPIRIGERFDSVLRQVVPRYRFEERRNSLQRFEMTTDTDGNANRDFTVPNRENASYIARITTVDGNSRTIRQDVFIGRDWSSFFWDAEGEPFLDGVNHEGYKIGDEVRLTLMNGTEPLMQGNILFVTVQDGIIGYTIGQNPFVAVFGERHVPNFNVTAFHFNGHTYTTNWRMSQSLRFNASGRELVIDIATDQDDYRPGDTVNVNISVTDTSGSPMPSNVNISLVDEALFFLMDYRVDTLQTLFRGMSDDLRLTFATHGTFVSEGVGELMFEDTAWANDMAMGAPEPAATQRMTLMDEDEGGREALIRERFEDTAVFMSLRTNEQGMVSFSFELPHNITSWRVTASAISESLYAGNSVSTVRVTQPMFLNYSVGSLFLVGDTPYIGINAFGTSLTGTEEVLFEVWREDFPDDIRSTTGRAFERVNIPLWEKTEEGAGALIIYVSTVGLSDALRHEYRVVNSHLLVDTAVFYEVTAETVFEVNPGGLTNITFMDAGQGRFLRDLFAIRNVTWRSGLRIEGLVARREATRIIERHFPDIRIFGPVGAFDIANYQQRDGGIAFLPYGNSNLRTTVMLMPFVMDEVNQILLREYLHSTNGRDRSLALYGLAMLGEPVLLEILALAREPGIELHDAVNLGLALYHLGDIGEAERLFRTHIAPHIVGLGAMYRIDRGGNRRELLEATTSAALLAAKLNRAEALGLHAYAHNQRMDDMIMNVERLQFISYVIENMESEPASITYRLFGETFTRELGAWRHFNLRIPAANMHEFELVETTGDVGAVSIVRTPLEEMAVIESEMTIVRRFFAAGSNTPTTTFNQGDMVRVEITVSYSPRSLEGSYLITDFLPAGFVHVPHSARFGAVINNTSTRFAFAQTEGQRVSFFDFNRRGDRAATYVYHARVISPGTFTAEGTLVQNVGAREYMGQGESVTITVKE